MALLETLALESAAGERDTWAALSNQALVRYGALRVLQREQPALEAKLDRLQPLVSSRPLDWGPPAKATEPVTPGADGEDR